MTLLLNLLACSFGDNPGGQSGEDSYGCFPQTSTPLALDEASPLGFTPQEMLDSVAAGPTATFTWTAGTTAGLALDTTPDTTSAAYVEYAWEDDGSGMEAAMGCANTVEIDADLGFHTDDGAFDEDFAVTLTAVGDGQVTWFVQEDLGDVAGTYDASELDTSDYDDVVLNYSGRWDDAGAAGTLEAQGSGTDGDTAYAENNPVGAWGAGG